MEKYNYRCERTYMKNNKMIKIVFCGNEKNNSINKEKIEETLDKCFLNFNYKEDFETIISWIRTIFRDFDEKYLEVKLSKTDMKKNVVYVDNKLQSYEEEKDGEKVFKYTDSKELQFNKNLNEGEIDVLSIVSKKIEQLRTLKNISQLKLNSSNNILCGIYLLFYNEAPDLFDPKTLIKMQMMIIILKGFGLDLDYDFVKADRNMPKCYEIVNFVNRKKIFGEVKVNLTFPKKTSTFIKTIGRRINEYVSKSDDQLDELIRIGTNFYDSKNGKNDEVYAELTRAIKINKLSNFGC